MKKNKESVVVYWSMCSDIENIDRVNMIWDQPKPLIPLLFADPKINKDSYISCSGMKNFFRNSFTLLHQVDSTIKFNIENNLIKLESGSGIPAWKSFETPAMDNRPRLTYDFSWIFFCEEDMIMEQLPPFLHNTSDRQGGVISTGSFNIAKWFRPINPDYIVWENSKELSVKKGDPAFYIRFLTDKKVILKQFEFSKELYDISYQILQHKNYFAKEPLETLYSRFTRSNRHKKVIKLIKDNLLE